MEKQCSSNQGRARSSLHHFGKQYGSKQNLASWCSDIWILLKVFEHQESFLGNTVLALRCRWKILIFHIHRKSASSFRNFERKVKNTVFKIKYLPSYTDFLREFRRLNFHKNNSSCFLLLLCITLTVALALNISFSSSWTWNFLSGKILLKVSIKQSWFLEFVCSCSSFFSIFK